MKTKSLAVIGAMICALATTPVLAAPQQTHTAPKADRPSQSRTICDSVEHKSKTPHLSTGGCFNGWKKQRAVTNYKAHGLRAPDRGTHWVESNGRYVLVNITTGIILGIVNAH